MNPELAAQMRETRQVRINDDGLWTMQGKADEQKPIDLCQVCTLIETCMTRYARDQLLGGGLGDVRMPITHCDSYRVAVPLRSEAGTERQFNTIRIGLAWAARVKPGAHVTLWHTAEDRPIGAAIVRRVFTGKWKEIAEKHARFNHTQIGLAPASAAPERLWKIMKASYGTNFFHEDREMSVIYLRRVD